MDALENLFTEPRPISKKLAPLGRLCPIEPDDDDDVGFHKEIDDWLDEPKGYQHGSHSYFD